VYSRNLVDHDQASFDGDEHGTAVAGVIASAANNDLGIVGVAPDVQLMVFKACHQEKASRRTSCDSVSIIKALGDVLVQQPDILNLSLSGPRDGIIERLLREVYRKNIVLVGAVDESGGLAESFPANMEEVIAVGTVINLRDEFTTVLLAPGTDMLTTAPGATYGFKSGSSMATAYVSGIVALMKERNPALSNAEVYEDLLASTRLDERELPVVDMCLAVKTVAESAHECERTPSIAVRGKGITNSF
jgi:subtilisin family serine protease